MKSPGVDFDLTDEKIELETINTRSINLLKIIGEDENCKPCT